MQKNTTIQTEHTLEGSFLKVDQSFQSGEIPLNQTDSIMKESLPTNRSIEAPQGVSQTHGQISTQTAGKNTSTLYLKMFEEDLLNKKEQTLTQLSDLKDYHSTQVQEIEVIKLENQTMKSTIARYMKLIKEKNEGSSKEPQQRRAQSTITP